MCEDVTVEKSELTGVCLLKKADDYWLSFRVKTGGQALLNLSIMAATRGPVVGDILLQWAKEQFPEETQQDQISG